MNDLMKNFVLWAVIAVAVLAVLTVVVTLAIGSLGWIGTEFMPRLDEGAILGSLRRPEAVGRTARGRAGLASQPEPRRCPMKTTDLALLAAAA